MVVVLGGSVSLCIVFYGAWVSYVHLGMSCFIVVVFFSFDMKWRLVIGRVFANRSTDGDATVLCASLTTEDHHINSYNFHLHPFLLLSFMKEMNRSSYPYRAHVQHTGQNTHTPSLQYSFRPTHRNVGT